MKDSGIAWVGKIPQEWQSVRSKFIIQSNDGGVWGGEPTDTDLDKIVLRSTEQTIEGKWKITGPAYRNLSTVSYKNCLIRPNDLLITKSSGSALHIGKTSLAGLEFANYEYYYSNFLQRIRVNKKYAPKYAWYIFNSTFVRVQFAFLQNATSGLGNINSEDIESVYIPLPPIDEQKRIVNYLDRECEKIDGLKADIQAQIDTLEHYKRSVITEVVTHGLNPYAPMKDSAITWIGQIPSNWAIGRIGGLYELRTQKVSDKDYMPLSVTMKGILPQLDTVAKTNDSDNRKLVRKGDFAINSRSDRRGSCGISNYDGSVSLINIILKPRNIMNANYYNWLFHTPIFADEFYKWGHGIVDDLWTTNWQEMKRITIPVPPLDEQQAIAKFLNHKCAEIEQILSDKKAQLETLDDYKKSLIFEYVTGKKEVVL